MRPPDHRRKARKNGLGRVYALDLAGRGASVVVNDLGGSVHGHGSDASIADRVVDEIKRADGKAVPSHHSVDTPEGGEAIVRTATDAFGGLDVVVSNAGIFNSIAFDELTPTDWRRMLAVHLDGAFYLSQPAFRVMKAQGYGRFGFTASSAAFFGQPLEALRSSQDRLAWAHQRDRDRRRAVRNSS